MKKFETPKMSVVRLEMEDVMRTSGSCGIQGHVCLECYCSLVMCGDTYSCKGLVCPTLDDVNGS